MTGLYTLVALAIAPVLVGAVTLAIVAAAVTCVEAGL